MHTPTEIAATMHAPRPFHTGTGSMDWAQDWCFRCVREDWENDTKNCPIVAEVLGHDKTPAEWGLDPDNDTAGHGDYVCIEFTPNDGPEGDL